MTPRPAAWAGTTRPARPSGPPRARGPRTACGPAVGRVRREAVEPVVAPAAIPRESRDGHDLDCGHPELAQRRQVLDRAVEGTRFAEAAGVQLVDHEVCGGQSRRLGGPAEAARVDDARGAS